MVGQWVGKSKISFGGRETEIDSSYTVTIDGMFLKSVAADRSNGFTLVKTTMMGWDEAKKEYISYTFTNIGATARIAHGKFEGGQLVMVSEPWSSEGQTAVVRETYSKDPSGRLGVTMEFQKDGGWVKGMNLSLAHKAD